MNTEYEVKILDIDVSKIKGKLEKLGAIGLGMLEQKRYVYDFNPVNPNKWIRLRQKGEKSELTIKEITDDSITGTKELEIKVSDFETANNMLEHMGYNAKAYQENKRESYELDGVQIEIDSWPLIPTYIEIEGEDEKSVEKVVKLLGYDMSDTTSINTTKVYKKYDIELSEIKDLRF